MTNQTSTDGMRKCPYCGEEIKAKAVLCKFCKSAIPADASPEGKPHQKTEAQTLAEAESSPALSQDEEASDTNSTKTAFVKPVAIAAGIIIAAGAGIIMLVQGHQNASPSLTEPSKSGGAEQSRQTGKENTCAIDLGFEVWHVKYHCYAVELRKSISYCESPQGCSYLLVYYTVLNGGPISMNASNWGAMTIQTSTGKRYSPDSQAQSTWSSLNSMDTELQPGVEKVCAEVFLIPFSVLRNESASLVVPCDQQGILQLPLTYDGQTLSVGPPAKKKELTARELYGDNRPEATSEQSSSTAGTSAPGQVEKDPEKALQDWLTPSARPSTTDQSYPAGVYPSQSGSSASQTTNAAQQSNPPQETPQATVPPPPGQSSASQADPGQIAPIVKRIIQAEHDSNTSLSDQVRTELDALPKPPAGDDVAAESLNKEGVKALNAKDYSKAVDLLSNATRTNPSVAKYFSNLGFAEMYAHDLTYAENHTYQSLALNPDRVVAWNNLGQIYARKGNQDDAVTCFLLAYRLSKGQSIAYLKSLDADDDQAIRSAGKAALSKLPTPAAPTSQ